MVPPAYWSDASPTVRYRLVDEHRTNDWPRAKHSRAITERHSGWFLLRTGSALLSFGLVRDLGALFSGQLRQHQSQFGLTERTQTSKKERKRKCSTRDFVARQSTHRHHLRVVWRTPIEEPIFPTSSPRKAYPWNPPHHPQWSRPTECTMARGADVSPRVTCCCQTTVRSTWRTPTRSVIRLLLTIWHGPDGARARRGRAGMPRVRGCCCPLSVRRSVALEGPRNSLRQTVHLAVENPQ